MSEVVLFVLVFLSLTFIGLWLIKLLFAPHKQGGLENFEHRLELLKIEFGKALLPTLEQAVNQMAELIGEFSGVNDD